MPPAAPLDADVAQLLDQIASAPALSEGTVAEARANYASSPKPPLPDVRRVEDTVVVADDGYEIPARLYSRDERPGAPIMIFFHGGGWVLSSVQGHDAVARRLAVETGYLVASVDYRLAPEHPFPVPHDDCYAVTAWATRNGETWGGNPDRVVVCGDSAGGNLAAGVALRARDSGLTLAHQVLIYPCIDDQPESYPSMRENGTGLFLTRNDMEWFWDQYVPPAERDNPYAVPARAADLSGVAPATVIVADYDPLRDEGIAYAARLRASDVDTTLLRYPGVVHGFFARWHTMARANEAFADLGQVLDQPV